VGTTEDEQAKAPQVAYVEEGALKPGKPWGDNDCGKSGNPDSVVAE
jgi:hypothetical protein